MRIGHAHSHYHIKRIANLNPLDSAQPRCHPNTPLYHLPSAAGTRSSPHTPTVSGSRRTRHNAPVTPTSVSPSSPLPSPDPLRVGIVGAGWMGVTHGRAWAANAPRARVVAVADPSQPRARSL
ncbi:MAG TPA: Gfo/Idh/MocA family oxidoreductase, partial [Chloroflexota bacterium]|nr:Gfo/Idh/MocA family oxidoreductase [Chloroflexota bacterium]